MQRGQTATVTAGHGLHQVERLAASDFTHHQSVGAHAQGRSEQVTDRHRSPAFGVRRTRLELQHVLALRLNLLRILDDDDPLPFGNVPRERVEHRRLPAARPPRDHDVQLADHHRLERLGRVRGQRPEPDEPLYGQRFLEEASNGYKRALGSHRRNQRLDAGAVREAPLQNGPRLVNLFAHELRRVSKHGNQALPGIESSLRLVQPALALDEDLVRTIDHDLADRRIVEKRPDGREELQKGLFVDFSGYHGTLLSREFRASSA